ncbi:MAG: zinc ribbon domain-containing protein [Candidatus Thioglobus sp.]|jgi:hypothetical protein
MIYTYKCKAGHETDKLRKLSNREEAAECDQCGGIAEYTATFPTHSRGATVSFGFEDRVFSMREEKRALKRT